MPRLSRRHLLGAAATALPFALAAPRVFGASRVAVPDSLTGAPPICRTAATVPVTVVPQKKPLKLTWNANAICTVGVPVAQEKGLFAKRNLDVELINFGGSTDQLLEAIATGKADA